MNVLLHRSIEHKEKIMLVYIDSQQNVTQRPVRVIKKHDDKIVAYCFLRRQVRTFRLDQILSVGPVGEARSIMKV